VLAPSEPGPVAPRSSHRMYRTCGICGELLFQSPIRRTPRNRELPGRIHRGYTRKYLLQGRWSHDRWNYYRKFQTISPAVDVSEYTHGESAQAVRDFGVSDGSETGKVVHYISHKCDTYGEWSVALPGLVH